MDMTKEEARAILKDKRSELRQAERVMERAMEIYENGIRARKESIEKLEAIINKKDDWRDELGKGRYTIESGLDGFGTWDSFFRKEKVEHTFKEREHAQLLADKMNLMQEMYAFAHVRNEGWVPDWKDRDERKWGVRFTEDIEDMYIDWFYYTNGFVFGIAVKSEEIAEEMLEEFGERIEAIYNKQY